MPTGLYDDLISDQQSTGLFSDIVPSEPSEREKAAKSLAETRQLIRDTTVLQQEQARKEGDRASTVLGLAKGAETAADVLARTRPDIVARQALGLAGKGVGALLDVIPGIPKKPEGAPDLTQQPVVSPEQAEKAIDVLVGRAPASSVGEGVRKAVAGAVSGLTDPATAFTMGPVAQTPALARPLFALPMIAEIPSAAERLRTAPTTAEQVQAGLELAGQIGFPALIERGLKPPPRLPEPGRLMGEPRPIPFPAEATAQDILESQRRAAYIAEQKAALEPTETVPSAETPTVESAPQVSTTPEAKDEFIANLPNQPFPELTASEKAKQEASAKRLIEEKYRFATPEVQREHGINPKTGLIEETPAPKEAAPSEATLEVPVSKTAPETFVSDVKDAEEIRQKIRNRDFSGLKAKVLMRNYGDTKAVVEINGVRFAIDDASRLKMAGIETDYSAKKTSQYFGLKTGADEIALFKSLPKLGLDDFKTKPEPTPVAEAKAEDLTPELAKYKRKTPAKGTPERDAIEAKWQEWKTKTDPLYDQITDIQEKRDRTKAYSKARDTLDKRLEKIREQRDKLDKQYKGIREQVRDAYREDRLEHPNPIVRLKQMDDLGLTGRGKESGYERVKQIVYDEAKRQGATDEEAKQAGVDAYSFTVDENITIPELVKRRVDAIRREARKRSIPDFVDTLETNNRSERQDLIYRLTNFADDTAKFEAEKQKILSQYQTKEQVRQFAEKKMAEESKAAAELEAKFSRAIKTETATDAKHAKRLLIQELESVLKEAPEEVGPGKVTIEIPGDGTFKVPNHKAAVAEVLARAKRLETTTTPQKPFTERLPTAAERKAAIEEAEKLEKQQPTPPRAALDFDPHQVKVTRSVNFALNQGKMRLSELIDAPELFAKYPQLQGTTIEVRPAPHKVGGWWDFENKNIVVSPQHEIPFRRTIIHEIQHAVDTIEGRPVSEANADKIVEHLINTPPPAAMGAKPSTGAQSATQGPPPSIADSGESGPGLSGMGAAAYGEIPPSGVLTSVAKALRGIRDFFTIDPVKALSRAGLGDAAYEHASARNSVVHTVRDLLSRVFPTQYKDPVAMAKTGDILTKDNILGIYDQARAARDAATTPQGRIAAQRRMTEIENAHDLLSFDVDVRAAMNDPDIAGNIGRWKQVVGPELDHLYNEMKARDPNTPREARGRHFQARVNLLPMDKAADLAGFTDGSQPMPEPSVANYRNPNVKRDPFARRAKGTGQYSTDPALMLMNSIGSRWNEVTKLRFYDAIVREGHGMITEPGERTFSEMDGEKLVRMPIKVPETIVTTELHNGQPVEFEKTKQVEKSLWIKQSLAREARDVLNTDMATPNNPIFRALTGIQLLQATDMVSHMKNIHTVIANSLGTSKGWQDAVRKMPFLATADTVGRIFKVTQEVMESGPEIRQEIAEMARRGLIRPEYPLTGIQKLTRGQQMIHAVDTAARVTMNRFWDNLVDRGMVTDSLKGRREFVQQIGEYNRRLLTPFIRSLRDYGASPFIVAGRTFNRFSKRLLLGDPGFQAATPQQAALARAYQISGLAAAVVLPAMVNYFTTGRFGGRMGTPLGAIDTGTDNDKGQHRILDVLQLMGIRRGLRATGAGAIIEGVRQGETANKMFGKAFDDITSTAAHPLLGPGLAALYSGLTGKRLDLRGGDNPYLSKNVGGGIKQVGENLRVTLKNQNPLIYGLVAPLVGETDDTYGEGLLKGFLKTPLSSLGIKEQTGTDPKGLIGQLHANWMERSNDPKIKADYERVQRAVFPVSKYRDLDMALKSKDDPKALDAIKELRKTETDVQIYQRFAKYSRGPLFHESTKRENDFRNSLTLEQKQIYAQALKDRTEAFKHFQSLWSKRGRK